MIEETHQIALPLVALLLTATSLVQAVALNRLAVRVGRLEKAARPAPAPAQGEG